MDYIADTHATLWHLFDPRRLGLAAHAAFESSNAGLSRICLPAVVVAEMIMVVERGRIPHVTMPELLAQLNVMQGSANYMMLPLLPETVIASPSHAVIPDIFDRLIVTEAQRLVLPLITRDKDIRTAGIVDVLWD